MIKLHATFDDYENRCGGGIVVRDFETFDRAEKQPRRML